MFCNCFFQCLTQFFIYLGVWFSFCFVLDNFSSAFSVIFNELCEYFHFKKKQSLREKYGEWAVITGSTDGIGKKYALELANKSMNIVLIARSETKLKSVASEIQDKYSVQTKWIVADFQEGEAVYDHIKKELEGINIGILVNNVGMLHEINAIDNISEKMLWNLIYVNIAPATILTQFVIPLMKKNKKGAIINISSGAEYIAMPFFALYSSTKAYMQNFTRCITLELKPYKNITVQLVSPLIVRTNMLNNVKPMRDTKFFFVVNLDSYAKSAVNLLGKTGWTTGYWYHGMQYVCMKFMPKCVLELMSYQVFRLIRYKNRLMK